MTIPPNLPDLAWGLIAALQLEAGPEAGEQAGQWLLVCLSPLGLAPGLRDAVLHSARQAVERALQKKHERVGLFVFAPPGEHFPAPAWGFFLIEKVEQGGVLTAAAIQIYLYIEKK